ncbi:rod shape-determining protein MreD [Halobacillus sp. ACCC02827]|uniref:rod shape-determining protein MreD n=1 Tax=Bacillaceae TaxID=186817 RepID=UPI0002A4EDF3|nr:MULTISPECIES: rod shape-determining protein MreD [Bacillaceae]ELK45705.1 cell-shape determining protein [Halobacillus sp. BAB-2008]QHT47296.1 rod shape-determining protein MreD [Bacillus sp. SB49]WJE14529.1 rod shape-determining protein MreD [Halobacillus sp. ACCC02827]
MSRYYIPLICLFLLVMQGMAMSLLPAKLVYSDLLMTPHWILIFLFLVTIFYDKDDTYHAVWYGLVFGLLMDVVYTGVLGVYMITYTLVIYIVHGLNKLVHANFFAASILAVVGVALCDTILYVVYSFVQITSMGWGDYLLLRLLPTLAANMIFFILLYPLLKERVYTWGEEINNA